MDISGPMVFALLAERWIFQALELVAVALELWAFVDAAGRRPEDFLRAGQRTKSFWLVLTGVALAVGVLALLQRGAGLGLFGLAAVCVACVYLAGPREELTPFRRR